MNNQPAPNWVHVFVCVNDRRGEKSSCADNDAVEIRARLKAFTKEEGWANRRVRVSQTGCLGLCAQGPNVLLFPEGTHYSGVTLADLPDIEAAIRRAVAALPGTSE